MSSIITFCVKYPEISTGLTKQELEQIDGRLVAVRHKVARGESLFQADDRFDAVFAVWTGFFKTTMASKDGREPVTGFQMAGELMGLDGIGSRAHEVDAVALEDSQVCVMPFDVEADRTQRFWPCGPRTGVPPQEPRKHGRLNIRLAAITAAALPGMTAANSKAGQNSETQHAPCRRCSAGRLQAGPPLAT